MNFSRPALHQFQTRSRQFRGGVAILFLLAGTVQAVPPTPPTNLTGNFSLATKVALTWTDNSTNEDGFRVDQSTASDFTQNLRTIPVSANTTALTLYGLTPNTAYWYRVRAFSWSLGESANCTPTSGTTGSVVQDPVPSPLAFADIGAPPLAGSVSYQAVSYDPGAPYCQYTLQGSGGDIYGTSDKFGFLYQTHYGDGELVAKVNSLDNPSATAKAGIMFRNTTAANSRFVDVVLTPSSGVALQYRSTIGGSASGTTVAGITAPRWVKLTRSGDTFKGYYSSDGRTWTQIGSAGGVRVTMNRQIVAGLGVTSNNTGQLCTAKIGNFSVKRGADAVPFGGGMTGYAWYTADKPFINRMKQCNTYSKAGTTTNANVDADGWPTEDFETYVMSPLASDLGTTYKLYADHVNQNPTITSSGGTVLNKVYDSGNLSVTADVYVTSSPSNMNIKMTGTNGGAKNIKLILPGYNVDTTETFNPLTRNLLGRCSAIRFMDMTSTNNSWVKYWADRSHVGDARYNLSFNGTSKGMPWELAVKMCNDTRRDMWINVPALADDTFITNLANLIKYGSDGVNAYTSTQASPVYPPLDADLNVFIEHSNETWNSMFGAYNQSINEGKAYRTAPYATAGYQPTLEDQGTLGDYDLGIRWHMKRSVDISNLFKAVFGAPAINSRIKVVWGLQKSGWCMGRDKGNLEWVERQYSAAPGTFLHSMSVTSYHGGTDGYFFYGLEARNNCTAQEVLDQVQAGADTQNSDAASIQYAGMSAFYGMKRTAYEGGLFLKDDIRRFTATSKTALHDALNNSAMATVLSTAANKYYQYGGNQWEYFTVGAGTDGSFCVTDDLTNQNTPRLNGLDAVLTAAPPAASLAGVTTLPGEINGAAHLNSNGGGGPFAATSYLYFRASGNATAYYLVNTPMAGNYTLTLNVYPKAANTTLDVAINNAQKQSLTVTKNTTVNWIDAPALTANLTTGLNVIRVMATGVTDTNINSLKFTVPNYTGPLLGWNMDGNQGTSPKASASNVPGVTASTLSLGSGLVGTGNDFFSSCWTFCRGQETSLANAVTNNRYVTFTVTPSGSTVTINSVSVYAWSRISPGSNYTLEASTSGFGSGANNDLGTWGVYANEGAPGTHIFALANPIVTSTPVEFRFYVWGAASQYSEMGFGKNNNSDSVIDLAVTGNIAGNGALPNTLPGISSIPSATTKALNTAHTFTLSPYDAETAAGNLTVTATSDNQVLVPNGNIVITGSGNTTRPITVTPAADQYGKARITFSVSDGVLNRSAYYDLTINPTLSGDQQALSLGKSASASGLSDAVNGMRAANATDGNRSTGWVSPPTGFTFNGTWDIGLTGATGTTQGHWLWVDLGGVKHIERVKLVFGGNYATDFKLQYPSTNPNFYYGTANWYDVPGGTVDGNTQQTVELTGLNVNQQYLRVFVAARANAGSGIEIKEFEVYGTAAYTTSTLINCGQTTGAPPTGWALDDGYSGGSAADRGSGITWDTSLVPAPVPPADVYRYERYGASTYVVGGLTPGATKTVRLHFAESYCTAAGQRVFHVKINGTQVLTNFDIFAAAGAQHKAVERNFSATADASGKITIQFINATDNAQINGIEVN